MIRALSRRLAVSTLVVALAACSPSVQTAPTPIAPAIPTPPPIAKSTVRPDAAYMLPPAVAFQRNLMPLGSTGVLAWRAAHPDWDGRGVLIAILDSGVDPNVEGLRTTSTGSPKLVDARDFSGEGRIPLTKVTPAGDSVVVAGKVLKGFGRLMGVNATGPWYGGALHELALGEAPAADVNWNNTVGDTLPVLVTRATDGWVLLADLDGDGSLTDEKPVHDYLVGRESFGWAPAGRTPSLSMAADFAEQGGEPSLDLYFDSFGHGTHVAGIATGSGIYGVPGFDGVAPGAEVLGLKIANDAQGGISTTGSMLAALDYAIKAAAQRQKPLVVNMSFGVGNEVEGTATIDHLIDSVLAAHPDVVFTISAGNDGPGHSTIGFPGSAVRAVSVGATIPRTFLQRDPGNALDPLAFFSSRGGELARPDLVTPGVAFSTVPHWSQGAEVEQGTSMAAPHAAGLAALLLSALPAGSPISAARLRQALMTTAQPLDGFSFIDQGAGVPNVNRAWAWLQRDRVWNPLQVRAVTPDGLAQGSAAFRPRGIAAGDTLQRFRVENAASDASAELTTRSDAKWLHTAPRYRFAHGRGEVLVGYDAAQLREPGTYVGIVTLWGPDTTAGPVARLVNTVVVPLPAGSATIAPAAIPAGQERHWSFTAQADHPFEARVATSSSQDVIRAYLHEPGGQPFRAGNELEGANGDNAAVFQVDARDVVAGTYEVVAAAPPIAASSAGLEFTMAPITLRADLRGGSALATMQNLGTTPLTANVTATIVGGVFNTSMAGEGADTGSLSFQLPAWVKRVQVDVQMPTVDWPRFTDFGVTLQDSVGRQIEKTPLNYAFGRLESELPRSWRGGPVALKLYPGWATTRPDQRWMVDVQVRLYGDDATAKTLAPRGSATVRMTATNGGAVLFAPEASPWPLPDQFIPLVLYTASISGGKSWTREAPLAPAPTPLMR